MSPVSHQTVRLSRGGHAAPDEGVCVVELASMLAGEPFSDRPACVCELIAAFLRCYNDACDDSRRQDLMPVAAAVVGTRSPLLEPARADACREAIEEVVADMPAWRRWRCGMRRSGRTLAGTPDRDVARIAGHVLASAGEPGHRRALALVDELVAVGRPQAVRRVSPGAAVAV